MAVAAGLAGYPIVQTTRLSGLLAAVGAAAVGLLALALIADSPAVVPGALALLGAEYALFLVLGDELDAFAPVYAAALLLAAELAYWSLEGRVGAEHAVYRSRLAALGAATLASLGACLVVLAAAQPSIGGGPMLLVGVLAAALALAFIARLARS